SYAALVEQFALAGKPILNGYDSIMHASNKIRSQQIMAKHRIPTPLTFVVESAEYVEEVMKKIGKFPVILKQATGTHGIGIMILESKRGLQSVVDTLVDEERSSGPIIIQQYVRESAGKDIRVFVVGNKVVAAMDRIAKKKGEFRSNFSLGGKIKIASLTEEEKKIAIKCAKVFGLHWTGVDLMRSKSGPQVIEVNSDPGLKGITQATGVDVAGHIIDYAVKYYKKLQKK
ncbi:MAG: 30S ribosomal protein S6--L-glutamate ligase, partial [Candidatus Magasanikbacteria bacterium CG10_big_fil_rev_8_21_14_0_10_43_6]